jgi:hypothetical protein
MNRDFIVKLGGFVPGLVRGMIACEVGECLGVFLGRGESDVFELKWVFFSCRGEDDVFWV